MESCPTCHKVRTPRFKERLSPREVEVFILTVQGKQSKVIADVLCVHEKTVKFHLTNIYKKTATKNRGELISGWFSGLSVKKSSLRFMFIFRLMLKQ
jgi:DNA-binding CsgD family transcriptional regulator